MLFRHRAPDRRRGRLGIDRGAVADLLDDDQPLLAVALQGESRGETAGERGVARRGRSFEVLRVVVAPAQDDQVLQPAGNEQLAVVCQEAEIAGAQEGTGPSWRQAPKAAALSSGRRQ
jgi:hypothetical protein